MLNCAETKALYCHYHHRPCSIMQEKRTLFWLLLPLIINGNDEARRKMLPSPLRSLQFHFDWLYLIF